MKNENLPKYLLCAKYDLRIVLKNRRLGAFEEHRANCSDCKTRVLLTKASLELLQADEEIKPLCQDCAGGLNSRLGKPLLAVTPAHLKEIEIMLGKIKAGNN